MKLVLKKLHMYSQNPSVIILWHQIMSAMTATSTLVAQLRMNMQIFLASITA